MTQSDSFIEEVTEEVRRDRLFAFMRRYGWIAIALVVLVVAGTSYREWTRARDQARAEALGDAIYAALEKPDRDARIDALTALSAEGETAALLSLLKAGEMPASGAAALRSVAEDETLPVRYTQLAALKLVMIEGRTFKPEERLAMLAPLAEPGRPYRPLALEQMALAEIDAGNGDKAIEYLQSLIQDAEASPGLRQRAAQLIVALGGEPDAG
ncbi:hypothetical protein RGUI_0367 [Rhodovulum sp. P5]|uniref:hypothetical protein n=1 Tax=Rhodovulum sp. P5 TaxID=1564506 RepID=UPI0009C2313B|nr:hypothetical protein [Rhodovulum sp. P5]ARE38508.1 hypothetical protein RGUI_0367 [Rhodovulum sp. P5]